MSQVYSVKIEKDIVLLEAHMNQLKSSNNQVFQKRLKNLKHDCVNILSNINTVITQNTGKWIQK